METSKSSEFIHPWTQLIEFSGRTSFHSRAMFKINPSGLTLSFIVEGKFDWKPVRSQVGSRRDHIWEEDCFEFFWEASSYGYYEINLSTQGDWQVYQFEGERSGRKNADFKLVDFSLSGIGSSSATQNAWEMTARFVKEDTHFMDCRMDKGGLPHFKFQCANIFFFDGEKYYFALKHPSSLNRPDFHNDEAWTTFERGE